MKGNKLVEKIKSMCSGKCYRCTQCINEVKNGDYDSYFYFCMYEDESKNIMPTFPEVFQTMRKLAKDGIDFYENAVQEYINAEESRKKRNGKMVDGSN